STYPSSNKRWDETQSLDTTDPSAASRASHQTPSIQLCRSHLILCGCTSFFLLLGHMCQAPYLAPL
ncbi:hypothetical protein COCVIDRAFT_113042, partial [Bipolaris victoriae FI3]